MGDSKPLVAIRCITYNHEAYIRDALEGFVMQQTNFPFVAIVHDDASTDNTAEIIREYAERYPEIIKPIYETENQYSKHDGSLARIMNDASDATGAKYCALCEGDDYWTDPLKLQKQVDFLEAHPDYSMCFGNAIEHWEDGLKEDRIVCDLSEGAISPLELYARWVAPTATILYRSFLSQTEMAKRANLISKPAFGDIQIAINAGFIGKLWYFNELFSIYRKTGSGMSSVIGNNPWPHIRTRLQLSKIYGKEYIEIDKKYSALYFIIALKSPLSNYPDNLKMLFRLLWFTPIECLKQFKWIYRSVKFKLKL